MGRRFDPERLARMRGKTIEIFFWVVRLLSYCADEKPAIA